MKKIITLLLITVMLFTVTACGGAGDAIDDASAAYTETYDIEVTDAEAEKYSGSMNESHYMMAAMILNNAGMDSDLDSYDEVYLVSLTLENGEEKAVVIADGEVIVP